MLVLAQRDGTDSADILCMWSWNEWTGDVVVMISPFPLRYYPVFHGGSFPRLLTKTAEPELQLVSLFKDEVTAYVFCTESFF